MLRELARIGNNLNQLAHAANRKQPLEAAPLLIRLIEIDRELAAIALPMRGPPMLIKFTGGGRGGGRSVAEYLTREEGRGHAPPEVVRGDMDRTRDLIDSIERKWSYTHGVLSFAPEDRPTEQQEFAMDAFERLAFAGLDREQYDITWVRHSHTERADRASFRDAPHGVDQRQGPQHRAPIGKAPMPRSGTR